MHLTDVSAHTNRWTQQHPGQKLLLAGGMLLLSLLLPPLAAAPFIISAMAGLTLWGARVPVKIYARFLGAAAAFAAIGALPIAVSVRWNGGGPPVAFSLQGAATAVRVFLRASAAVSCLLFLALTTPLAALVAQLRRLGIPVAVTELMLLVYRMLWLLSDVFEKMRNAQAARLGYAGLRQARRSAAMLASSLFWHVMDRARRLEAGVDSRGFQGDLNVLMERPALNRCGIGAILALQVALAAASLFLARKFPWLR